MFQFGYRVSMNSHLSSLPFDMLFAAGFIIRKDCLAFIAFFPISYGYLYLLAMYEAQSKYAS